MATQDLNIRIKLKDEFTGSLGKLSKQIGDTGAKIQAMGQQMSRAGTNMIFLGGAITGAFGVALNNASKYSIQTKNSLDRLNNAMVQFQVTVAQAVLPVVNQLANVLGNLVRKFQEMDPHLRNQILTITMLSGIWLTFGGTIMKTAGTIFKLFGFLAKNPALLAFAAVTVVIVTQWDKLKNVVFEVARAVEMAFNTIVIGFHTVLAFIWGVLEKIMGAIATIDEKMGRMKWMPFNKYFEQDAKAARNLQNEFKLLREASDMVTQDMSINLERIVISKKGSLEGIFDKISGFFKGLTSGGGMQGLQPAFNALQEMAKGTAMAMQNAFTSLFFNAFKGEMGNLKDIVADFGNQMLQMISGILAKLLIYKTIGNIGIGGGTKLGSLLFHQGGVIRAHSGYLANDEVPIIAQAGEAVLSRRAVSNLGAYNVNKLNKGEKTGTGGGVTINVQPIIQLWDASDVQRNKSLLVSAVSQAITNNSQIRKIIKEYA